MQIIPALDLLGTDAVRLERGDYDRVLFREPLEAYLARIVASNPPLIHVVDLQGARDGAVRPQVLARCLDNCGGIPLQASGGLRTVEAARLVLEAGVARVIVGTAAWETRGGLADFHRALGEQLVVALDVRDGRLAVRGWRSASEHTFEDALAACRDVGIARLHVTAIDRDGTMSGPDLALYETACASGIPVIAAGGIRHGDDLAALEAIGCEGAIMGVGYFSYRDATTPPTRPEAESGA